MRFNSNSHNRNLGVGGGGEKKVKRMPKNGPEKQDKGEHWNSR